MVGREALLAMRSNKFVRDGETVRGRSRFLLVLCFFVLALPHCGCDYDKKAVAKLNEINNVWAALPMYPSMQVTYTSSSKGYGKALVSKHFRCDCDPSKVKEFYVEYLLKDGWSVTKQDKFSDSGDDAGGYEVKLRKGDINIAIEYPGKDKSYGWDYGISIDWTNWRSTQGFFYLEPTRRTIR